MHHLITARSGVCHPASNSGDNSADAPPRGSQEPPIPRPTVNNTHPGPSLATAHLMSCPVKTPVLVKTKNDAARFCYAHTLPDAPPAAWQRMEDHLAAVARRAASSTDTFEAAE